MDVYAIYLLFEVAVYTIVVVFFVSNVFHVFVGINSFGGLCISSDIIIGVVVGLWWLFRRVLDHWCRFAFFAK